MSVYSGKAWLYFIRPVGRAGPVKIGITLNPHQRLACHQTYSPVALEYAGLAEIDGAAALERALHRQFADVRSHSDWFAGTEELYEAIGAVVASQAGPERCAA